MRTLLVEDDRELAQQLSGCLRGAGYAVDIAYDGRDAEHLGITEPYDAVVLDLGLPVVDGLTVLNRWRGAGRVMPVLILTARGTWRDKVTGLRAGADDYLAKPFEPEELLARLEALTRRVHGHADTTVSCGPLTLDTTLNQFKLNGEVLELTALEYRMLAYMVYRQGRVISKSELTEHIYEQDFDRDSNVIEVLINRLRKKLGAESIRTHRGRGYELRVPEDP